MGYSFKELSDFLDDNVGGYAKVLGRKISHWNYYTGLQFDEQGRAIIGTHKIEINFGDYLSVVTNASSLNNSMALWGGLVAEALHNRKLISEAQFNTLMYRHDSGGLYSVLLIDQRPSYSHNYQAYTIYGRELACDIRVGDKGTYDGTGTFGDYERDRDAYKDLYPDVQASLLLEDGKLYLKIDGGQPIKYMSLLEDAQKLWEVRSDKGRAYKGIMNMIKALRKKGATLANSKLLRELTSQKENYAKYSLWAVTDRWLQNVGSPDKEVILSVNPFDHFMMAGGQNGGYNYVDVTQPSGGKSYHPTKFRTCWGVYFYHDNFSRSVAVATAGEYSAINPMLAYGCVTTKAVMYVRNSEPPINTKVDGLDLSLHGVEYRAHAFLVKDKIWFDMLYPKVTEGLRESLQEALGDNYLTKEAFKDLARAQDLVGKQGEYYAINMELLGDDGTTCWFDTYENNTNFLDGVAMDMDAKEAYLFYKTSNREKSARIQAGYDGGHDLSPLQNAGILSGGDRARCEQCGCHIDMDDGDYYIGLDDDIYCDSSCFAVAGYRICDECGETYRVRDEILAVNGRHFCSENCAHNANYECCEWCSEWHPLDNMIQAESNYGDTYYYCEASCAEAEGYRLCTLCGEYRDFENDICEECADDDDDDDDVEDIEEPEPYDGAILPDTTIPQGCAQAEPVTATPTEQEELSNWFRGLFEPTQPQE